MDADNRPTDDEVRRVRAMECSNRGHMWDVLEALGSGPVALVCSNGCGTPDRQIRPALPDDEWEARSLRVNTEQFVLMAAAGIQSMWVTGEGWKVSAEPAVPNDDDPSEPREYFVTAPVLEHSDGGMVTGVVHRRYRVTLEPAPETPAEDWVRDGGFVESADLRDPPSG